MDESDSAAQRRVWERVPCSGPYVRELLSLRTRPVPELQMAVYDVMQQAARHMWGVAALYRDESFHAWLMNRGSETTKEGISSISYLSVPILNSHFCRVIAREAKYALVEALLQHRQALESALGAVVYKDLLVYHKLGPHYQDAEARVDVASEHA